MMEFSLCSKGGKGEGEAAVIAGQPASQGIEPGTTESVDQERLLSLPPRPAPLMTNKHHSRLSGSGSENILTAL